MRGRIELVWVGGGGPPSPTLPSPAPPASCKPEAGCWASYTKPGSRQSVTPVLHLTLTTGFGHPQGTCRGDHNRKLSHHKALPAFEAGQEKGGLD